MIRPTLILLGSLGLSGLLVGCGTETDPPPATPQAASGPAPSVAPRTPTAADGAAPAPAPVDEAFFAKLRQSHGVSFGFKKFPWKVSKAVDGETTEEVELASGSTPGKPYHRPYVGHTKPVFEGRKFRQNTSYMTGGRTSQANDVKVQIQCEGELSPDGKRLLHLTIKEVYEDFDHLGEKGLGPLQKRVTLEAKLEDVPLAEAKFSGMSPRVEFIAQGEAAEEALDSLSHTIEEPLEKTSEHLGSRADAKSYFAQEGQKDKRRVRVAFWYPSNHFEER